MCLFVSLIALLQLSLNYNGSEYCMHAVDSLNVKHKLRSKRVSNSVSCSVSCGQFSKQYFLVCHLKIVFYLLHELKQRSSDVSGWHNNSWSIQVLLRE